MSKEYDPKRVRDLAESWNGEYFCVIRKIEHFKVQLAMCFQNSRWQTRIPHYPKKHVLMISQ